jgi:hypothetical protein
LQALPSEHEVPFVTAVAVQPLAGLHESVVHGLPSLQTSGVPAAQVPLWHVSSPLQGLPSLQEEPLTTAVFTQPLEGLQLSVVHTLPSLQLRAVPDVQVPL